MIFGQSEFVKESSIMIQNPKIRTYISELIKRIYEINNECIVKYEDLGNEFCKIIIFSYEDIGHLFSWLDYKYEKRNIYAYNRCINRYEYITLCVSLQIINATFEIHQFYNHSIFRSLN